MKEYRAVDLIQWIWKNVFNVDYSKTKIRQDLKQGAIKINGRKIKETDIIVVEDEQ